MINGLLNRDEEMWRKLLSRTGDGGMELNIDIQYAYDRMFNLYPDAEFSPLKMIAQHPAEDPWDQIGRKRLIKDFVQNGIKEYMSLDAYLKADFPIARAILECAKDVLSKQTSDVNEMDDKLRQEEEAAKRAAQRGN